MSVESYQEDLGGDGTIETVYLIDNYEDGVSDVREVYGADGTLVSRDTDTDNDGVRNNRDWFASGVQWMHTEDHNEDGADEVAYGNLNFNNSWDHLEAAAVEVAPAPAATSGSTFQIQDPQLTARLYDSIAESEALIISSSPVGSGDLNRNGTPNYNDWTRD